MEKIESIDQAKRAEMLTPEDYHHPASVVPFFTSTRASPTSLEKRPMPFPTGNTQFLYNPSPLHPQLTAGQTYVTSNGERDKYTKMKLRKEAKKDRAERKVKTVITDGDQDNYNIDNVLQELGEEPGKKSNNKGKNKNKLERKRSKNNANSKKEHVQSDIKESPSGSDEEDEEDEVKVDQKISVTAENFVKMPAAENFSTLVINSSNSSSVNLTRQTSRSTEDLFTPVIKKQKWKNKKVVSLTSKDDSGHTYSSSSSSASSTTSTSAMVTSANDKQRPYNLRRKSNLRPSQSFDTMKSTTSSIVSDGDTMEAVAASSEAGSNISSSTKDHLDLASDFPPLLSNIVDQNDPPKWVIKNNVEQQNSVTSTSQIVTSSASITSSSTSSAVIDASDDLQTQQNIGPPPDVTVGAANRQQCTAGLPDIAAQAPFFMNTANSSGVSSNAGDLTPPQTSVSEQSFFTLEEDNENTANSTSTPSKNNNSNNNNKIVVNSINKQNKDTSPAVVMLIGDTKTEESNQDATNIEFGFGVNVLDFMGSHSELHEDDEAIISFVANDSKMNPSALDSPESGIGSMMSNPDDSGVTIKTQEELENEPPIITTTTTTTTINDAVNIPNYAQLVQFVTKSWKQVQQEIKQGLVVRF